MFLGRTRRAVVTTAVTGCVLAACSGVTPTDPSPPADGSQPATSRDSAPNVLLIVTDDQREGLNVMPRTRSLLVKRGVKFKNAFVTTPLCCPSRATILSGQYVHRHNVRRNQEGAEIANVKMVQQRLRRNGYSTAFFGKFINYWNLKKRPPGFDRWAITSNDTYYDGEWNVNGTMTTVPEYSTTYIRRRAIRYLRRSERRDARPWMMVLSTSAPHGPQTPERKYEGAPVPAWNGNPATRDTRLGDKPAYVRHAPEAYGDPTGVREAQLRTLMSVDDLVDRTLAALKSLNEQRRTLVIFISDNGMLWGEFGMTGKTHAYTPSIKVPMMLRWPGRAPSGRVDRRLVTNVDIVPTILDAADVSDRGTDGRSLLRDWNRDVLLLEYWRSAPFSAPQWKSLRTKRYQYVEYFSKGGRIQFREYFRLKRDPWQLNNILRDGRRGNNPDVRRLSRKLRRLSDCHGDECP